MTSGTPVTGMVKYATWSKATLLLFLDSSDPSQSGPLLLAMVVTNSLDLSLFPNLSVLTGPSFISLQFVSAAFSDYKVTFMSLALYYSL